MLNLSKRQQILIAVGLFLVMALTRSQHIGSLSLLPDASAALFLIAGVYLASRAWFGVLLIEAAVIDWLAISVGGVGEFCVTPAYAAMIVAYAAMWFAGRWFARGYRLDWKNLGRLAVAALIGGIAFEMISSGAFYFGSGLFAETSLAGFAERLVQFGPFTLQAIALYVGVTAITHLAVSLGWESRQTA